MIWFAIGYIKASDGFKVESLGQSICLLKPRLMNFRNGKFIQTIDFTTCHVAQRNANWFFLGVWQHENKVSKENKMLLKIFSNVQFNNLSVDHSPHAAPHVSDL